MPDSVKVSEYAHGRQIDDAVAAGIVGDLLPGHFDERRARGFDRHARQERRRRRPLTTPVQGPAEPAADWASAQRWEQHERP